MNGDQHVLLFTAEEVARGQVPAEHAAVLRTVLDWSEEFLVSPHPDLGRTGPVCPYTQSSLRKGLYHLAVTRTGDLGATVAALRSWYERFAADLSDADRELLTVLVALPHLDHTDSTELDAVQRAAKDEFVAEGLMIGQFHPVCAEPGLWNDDFRPLVSPVPLLAIRQMLVFDLLFVVDDEAHLDSYLRRFAPAIPSRVRDLLTVRLRPTGLPGVPVGMTA